ncbi:hypothetical protein GGR58DRAFT_524383 [Xylaria digitata]|nr:hypothetical protein GGR58DRAFT_524383 [Xylaria digitata]
MSILRSLPSWPNPQESIGRQILSSRVGTRKVWYSQGPALEAFEKVIQPEIENNLKQLDLGRAEIFIRLYMIGRNSENANPIIMICSTNKTAREAAEATIRESGLLKEHQGFGLGAAALPLEHPTPVRRLSPDDQGHNFSAGSNTSHDTVAPSRQTPSFLASPPFHPPSNPTHPPSDSSTPDASSPLIINALITSVESGIPNTSTLVCASSTDPRLGRRIFSPTKKGQISQHYATAGIVIKVDEDYFQLTVGHLFEVESETSDENQSLTSLDECHFDGQSSDEYDSDYESEITGRGSATPEDAQSRDGSSSDSTNENINDGCTVDILRDSHQETNMLNQQPTNILPHHQTQKPISSSSIVRTNPANLNLRFPIGHLSPGRLVRPTIDYAMIALNSDSVNIMGKDINAYGFSYPPVEAVAEVGHKECSIIVVTSSTIIRGILIPGKVAYRSPRPHGFDRLVQIILELEVFEGDCGSPVIDESSGSLYGHIVMGVAGTRVAYIVQAVDIFQDIITKTDIKEIAPPLADSHELPLSEGWCESYQTSVRSSARSRSSKASTSTGKSAPYMDITYYAAVDSLPCEFVRYGSCDRSFDQRMYHIRDHFLNERATIGGTWNPHSNPHPHNPELIPDESYHTVRRRVSFTEKVPQSPWMLENEGIPEDERILY